MLSVNVSSVASSNAQNCVLNGMRFLLLVFDMIGLHMVFAYFQMGQVIALKVEMISSLK